MSTECDTMDTERMHLLAENKESRCERQNVCRLADLFVPIQYM